MATLPEVNEMLITDISDGTKYYFPLLGQIGPVAIDSYQGKVVTGDYTRDSDPVLSTFIVGDLTGGHGVARLRSGDTNRCRWSTFQTRYPNQLAPGLYVSTFTGANTTYAYPLGDLNVSGTYRFYAAFGTAICKWTEGTFSFGASLGALPAQPVNKAVQYQGSAGNLKLWIPCGSSGYGTIDTADTVATAASPTFVSFLPYDNKLLGLDTTGQVHICTDGSTWSTASTAGVKLSTGIKPKHLLQYRNRAGTPTPFVVSDQGIFAIDLDTPALWPTEVIYPAHPYQGQGAAIWRSNMYVTVGMGMFQFNGEVNSPVGLDRDDGLPYDYRGYMNDLEAEYNGLHSLVVGRSDTGNYYSIQTFNGFGWHTLYASSSAVSKLSWVRCSNAQGVYRLWWGEAGSLRSCLVPTEFTNPRSLVESGVVGFDTSGYYELQTGYFNADMEHLDKLASHVTATLFGGYANSIQLWYRILGDGGSWTSMGAYTVFPAEVVTQYQCVWQFGSSRAGPGSGDTFYGGLTFKAIELRLMYSGQGGVDSLSFSYTPMPAENTSFAVTVDCSKPHRDKSPATLMANLETIRTSRSFHIATIGTSDYRIRFSQVGGQQGSGQNPTGTRTVNLIEVNPTVGAGVQ